MRQMLLVLNLRVFRALAPYNGAGDCRKAPPPVPFRRYRSSSACFGAAVELGLVRGRLLAAPERRDNFRGRGLCSMFQTGEGTMDGLTWHGQHPIFQDARGGVLAENLGPLPCIG